MLHLLFCVLVVHDLLVICIDVICFIFELDCTFFLSLSIFFLLCCSAFVANKRIYISGGSDVR